MLYQGAYPSKTFSHRVSVASVFCVLMPLLTTTAYASEPLFAGQGLRGSSEVAVVVDPTAVVTPQVKTADIVADPKPSKEVVGSIPMTVNRSAKTRRYVASKKTNRIVAKKEPELSPELSADLRGVLKDAVSNSDGIKIAIKQVHISDTKIWAEIAKFTPTINMTLDASRSSRGFGNLRDAERETELSFALNMPIYTGGQRVFSLRAARSNKMAAKNDAISAQNRVLLDVLSAYLQYHQTEETVKLLGQNVSSLKKLLTAVRNRKDHGVASQADVAYVQANLASMRQQHEAAKGSKSQIRAQIESLTGRKFKNLPKLMRVAKLVSSDEEQLVQAAMAANPEIKAAQHRAVSQRHTSRAAYGQYLPQVNLYAQHDRAISAYSSSRQTTDWKVGVTLTMPLVDLSTVSSIAESRQRAQLASYQASDTKRNIALSVRSLYHQYTAGRKQIDLAQARVKYMRQIETAERERYNQGVGSLDQLLEQKRALAQSKIDEIGVKTDAYWTAYQLLIAANKFDLNKLGL